MADALSAKKRRQRGHPAIVLTEGRVLPLTHNDVLFAAMMLGGIIVVRLGYSVFLMHRVLTAIRDKHPAGWSDRNRLRWIGRLVAGNLELSLPDNDDRRRLSSVRWNLGLCLAYLVMVLVAIAWITA